MLSSIHQPDYLPWLGYFDKIKRADLFIFLDRAQYSKNGFHNRNKIKTPQGFAYLTIPIEHSQAAKPMNQVLLPKNNSWQKKHARAIQLAYSKAPCFKEHWPFFEELYQKEHHLLAEFNLLIINYLIKAFGFKTKLLLESTMAIEPNLRASSRLVELIKKSGSGSYLSGPSGKNYLDLELFEKANIKVDFQDYHPKPYGQLFGQFIPGLSAIDLLFNQGPNSSQFL